jgi:protein O-mannosyl-transferase
LLKSKIQNKNFLQKHRMLLTCLLLVAATLVVYAQVRNHDFVSYDDEQYVTRNDHVQGGLTLENVKWAFMATDASNWHPLTWLSHMLDVEIHGLNPGPHHLTNLIFHMVNTLLLFFIFRQMTGAFRQSAFVAALFALHPLHVESVAWIAERKDVLSTFFWLLTLRCYGGYVKSPDIRRYVLVFVCFALGLLAKPMLVTLPFVLLLFDYWPLGRVKIGTSAVADPLYPKAGISSLFYEKIPLFVLAAASSLVTFLVQQKGGAVKSLEIFSVDVRIANALNAYIGYIGKMFWPHRLGVLYPHPGELPIWQTAAAFFLLVIVTLFSIRFIKKAPYLIIGWLWYLGTLVPVIGLVQVGTQAMADRYTYIPIVGLFVMLAWGIPELFSKWHYRDKALALIAAAVLSVLTVTSWMQLRYWKNSLTLYRHTLEVTVDNEKMYNNLGYIQAQQGLLNEAIPYYRKAIHINPEYAKAHNNLGDVLGKLGRIDEAIVHHKEALWIRPDYAGAYNSLGVALNRQGKADEAIKYFQKVLHLSLELAVPAHNNLALALASLGRLDEALSHFKEVVRLKPNIPIFHLNLGDALAESGRLDEAIDQYREALRLKPDFPKAHNNLGMAQFYKGNIDRSIIHFKLALRMNPGYVDARENLQKALTIQGRRP